MELLALALVSLFIIWAYKLTQDSIEKKASQLARIKIDSNIHKMRELNAIARRNHA